MPKSPSLKDCPTCEGGRHVPGYVKIGDDCPTCEGADLIPYETPMLNLQDLQPGDTIVFRKDFCEDWGSQVIESVTPTQIRSNGWVYDRKTGRERGAHRPLFARIVFPSDLPAYVAYRDQCTAIAVQIAASLTAPAPGEEPSLTSLRKIASLANVKLKPAG